MDHSKNCVTGLNPLTPIMRINGFDGACLPPKPPPAPPPGEIPTAEEPETPTKEELEILYPPIHGLHRSLSVPDMSFVHKPGIPSYEVQLLYRNIKKHEDISQDPSDWDKLIHFASIPNSALPLVKASKQAMTRMKALRIELPAAEILEWLLKDLELDHPWIRVAFDYVWSEHISIPGLGRECCLMAPPRPSVTIGHGHEDVVDGVYQPWMMPFYTPIESDARLLVPCVAIEINSHYPEAKHRNLYSAACMLKNMLKTRLKSQEDNCPARALTLIVGEETVSLSYHWTQIAESMMMTEYLSKRARVWNVKDRKQLFSAVFFISKAIHYVLHKNRKWLIGRIESLTQAARKEKEEKSYSSSS